MNSEILTVLCNFHQVSKFEKTTLSTNKSNIRMLSTKEAGRRVGASNGRSDGFHGNIAGNQDNRGQGVVVANPWSSDPAENHEAIKQHQPQQQQVVHKTADGTTIIIEGPLKDYIMPEEKAATNDNNTSIGKSLDSYWCTSTKSPPVGMSLCM